MQESLLALILEDWQELLAEWRREMREEEIKRGDKGKGWREKDEEEKKEKKREWYWVKWWRRGGKKWGGDIKKRIKRREEDIGWKDEEKG